MNRQDTIKFLILRSLGTYLVLVALFGVVMTFGPILRYELQYQIIRFRHIQFIVENISKETSTRELSQSKTSAGRMFTNNHVTYKAPEIPMQSSNAPGFADILSGNKEQVMIPIDPLFSILIPKLGIDEKVFPNVDPNNPQIYLPLLQQGVAHAKGSVFPGTQGTTYLFAHSAENWWDIQHYNAIFYTLNNLSVGDEIDIFFNNKRYEYVVTEEVISDPQDVSLLTEQHTGSQQLVLQTCWPPGTSFKRLYVIAVPKASVSQT
jgi:LPXTG-site transpeptidase (sortase) family protein